MTDGSRSSGVLPKNPGRAILRGDEAEAWQNGFRFLAEAQRAAGEVVAAAQTTYRQEHERGYADGFEQGVEEATQLVVETSTKVDAYLASIEREVIELSLGIVRQVLGSGDRSEAVAQAARNALTAFRREKFVKVSVHPDVVDDVRERLTAEAASAGLPLSLTVTAEPALEPYGCVVASEFAVIDAGLEMQIRVIGDALRAAADAEGDAGLAYE